MAVHYYPTSRLPSFSAKINKWVDQRAPSEQRKKNSTYRFHLVQIIRLDPHNLPP